ncbi:choline dehydrogenase [Trinickia dabaoshanensis]|uniref:Choline dehydrogenase n=1 Tax=Trinickia dabaoshanensis TaxID=564714 RepID=A0A2N7VXZ4_9BURK|nr:TorF family putative porin [Trinickia dabaoshanensis]PMS22000.1 choline dehydrogenase [Trinickia dabaoshanensis]
MSQRKTQSRLSSAALGSAALLIGSLHASAALAQTADTTGTNAAAPAATAPAAAAPAAAASAPSAAAPAASPFTANVTLASQYVSRGFRQTWGKPAIQGGFDYTNPNGLFAGTWLSTVSSKFIEGGSVEWDLYGGYGGSLGDLSYTGTVYYYVYPGARMSASATNYNYGEFVAALTYKWFTAKYWLTYTPNYFGYDSQSLGVGSGQNSRGSGYLDLNTNIDLTHGVSLLVHYGWQRVQNFSAYNWQDAKVAVSKTFDGGWTLTGAVTKGWGATNVYDRYTTGAPDSSGNIAVSNPLQTTFFATLTKVF